MQSQTLLFAVAATLVSVLPAQRNRDDLVERRDAKLKKPFVTAAPWILDFAKARATAQEQGRFVLAYFTRSYAA